MLGKTKSAKFFRFALFSAFFAYGVVLLGAFTRVSDAGLGCPDWPGCYGRLFAPTTAQDILQAKQVYPDKSVESPKAWKEMVHRYVAGSLGLLIVRLAALGWQLRKRHRRQQYIIPAVVMVLVFIQAVLGMLTVTLQLKPLIVMAHLVCGLSVLGLLWWIVLREHRFWRPPRESDTLRSLRPRALIGLAIVIGQIALGGWTSANYAALVCPDFPTCQGVWWPNMDFVDGFTLWRGLGINYEGGVLTLAAATAVHMAHRLGALITVLYVGWLAVRVVRIGAKDDIRRYGVLVLVALVLQAALGITNVVTHLPVAVAVAHNGVAALLLLSIITLNHAVRPRKA
jgi:cytochrome c oxidase assembly protein subunit 15